MTKKTPHVLIVLDGWGHRDETDANAIAQANTPNWDRLWKERAHTLISGSGLDVGLPSGQMGNSEVGHMNLGAGRVVHQELTRIGQAIEDGSFNTNPVLVAAADKAAAAGKRCHIFGLLSPGGVHSHEDHIKAAVRLAFERGVGEVLVHAFLDGRDVPPRSAAPSIEAMDAFIAEHGNGRIATVTGRYYAMDRDQRWDRVQAAYDMLTLGKAEYRASTAAEALAMAYERDENDEFVKPTTVGENGRIEDGDVVIFMNFRADRARQITRAFVQDDFDGFERTARLKLGDFVMLTQYAADIPAACAFEPASMANGLGEYLAAQGKTQLRLAETEKYAHVTFFFSGGREEPFDGETRVLVPSPKVATYDLQPEMSAAEVTDELVAAISSGDYDLIVCNYANGDMVGHTGVMSAAIKAVECLDECLGRIEAAIVETGGHCLITADHGNVEKMNDEETGQAHTAHTSELVPLVYIGDKPVTLSAGGALSDIAPTILELMGIRQPPEMTGHSLIEPQASAAAR